MAALRALAAARPPAAPTRPTTLSSSKPRLPSLTPLTSLTTAASLCASYGDAKALSIPKDQIVNSLSNVENAINQTVEFGSGVAALLQQIIDAVRPGVDSALPLFQQAGSKAFEIAAPFVSGASKQAQDALLSSGFDPAPALYAAKTLVEVAQRAPKVVEDAKPIASATVETITSSDPQTLVVAAGATVLSYFLLPPLWSVISFSLRGYQGDLTPAQALDLICTQNYLMVDVRSEKDKSKAGIPRLPSSAKNKMISIPLEELPSKVRGIVKSVKNVEAEIAALKVSYLKRVNKSSNIVIMDSYCDSAKIVAKTLTALGFKSCWTVLDGFSGGRGWVQSRLGTDSNNLSLAEVLSPSRIIPPASGRLGTTSLQSTQRFLPGSD